MCTGNTCRSLMAHFWTKHLVLTDPRFKGLEVSSCGTRPWIQVEPNSVEALRRAGCSTEVLEELDTYLPQPIVPEILADCDRVICATSEHLREVKRRVPAVADKCELLLGHCDLFDPYGEDMDVYDKCLKEIILAVDNLF